MGEGTIEMFYRIDGIEYRLKVDGFVATSDGDWLIKKLREAIGFNVDLATENSVLRFEANVVAGENASLKDKLGKGEDEVAKLREANEELESQVESLNEVASETHKTLAEFKRLIVECAKNAGCDNGAPSYDGILHLWATDTNNLRDENVRLKEKLKQKSK